MIDKNTHKNMMTLSQLSPMIDINTYKNMTWETPSDELEDAVENLLAEVTRLRLLVEYASHELRWLGSLDMNMINNDYVKTTLDYNIRKWEGEEE